MCGIAGIIHPCLNKNELDYLQDRTIKNLELMAHSISHRGPDNTDIWSSNNGRVGFAHTRLSIIDLSEKANQPLTSCDKRFTITFNGEIYNYKEIRSLLKKEGIIFNTNSDTEVLIECYRQYGSQCLDILDGMYAFVIYDSYEDKIFAARDPFGEKPFFYTFIDSSFYFSSELTAISQLPEFDSASDIKRISEFLTFQYTPSDRTIFKTANKLLPGHYLTLSPDNKLTIKQYFEFYPNTEKTKAPVPELLDELENLLIKNIQRRLQADVPIGAFLSSGIDSSLVVAIAQQKLQADIQTFTIGFNGWDDSEHLDARNIASHLKTRHTECILTPQSYQLIDKLGVIIDDPNADTSLLPTYLVSELARKSVKVVLSGDGADELFAGYGRYISTLSELNNAPQSIGKNYYSNKILHFSEQELERILNNCSNNNYSWLFDLRATLDHSELNLIDRLRKTDIENYLPGAVLAKVDRMSMQHGLEVRTPFLSIEMARFAEKLPPELLIKSNKSKIILRKLAERYLPKQVTNKVKKGFGVPFVSWGEDKLINKFSTTLKSNNAIRDWWLNTNKVTKWFETSLRNNNINIYKLWTLYHLNLFMNRHHIRPDIQTSPIRLWSLKILLEKSKSSCVIFSRLPVKLDDKFIKIKNITTCSIWEYKNEKLTYNINNDWIHDFKSVVNHFKNIDTLIFVDNILDISNNHNKLLRKQSIKEIIYYQDNSWKTLKLTPFSVFNSSEDITPAFFSINEKKFIPLSLNQIWQDFKFFSRSTFLPFTFNNQDNPFLEDKKRLFLDKNTPKRSFYLLLEIIESIKYIIETKKLKKQLTHVLKTNPPRTDIQDNKIIFILPSLYSGGAERQACNLMVNLSQRGFQVMFLSLSPLIGSNAHYLDILLDSGIEIIDMNNEDNLVSYDYLDKTISDDIKKVFQFQNPIVQKSILPVFFKLTLEKPRAVVCFLDIANIFGGIGASLAGIPDIVVSFRNINPTHFSFYENWYPDFYKPLLHNPHLTLTGNSIKGNSSYANWLGIPEAKIKLLRNGLDFSFLKKSDTKSLSLIRETLNLSPDDMIIAGIFRLSEEKRPDLFIKTFYEVRKTVKNLKGFIIGEGPMQSQINHLIHKLALSDSLYLPGPVHNVSDYISLATIVLQTSSTEGTANSLIEAQYLGKAVIATNGGGVSESLKHGMTGYVVYSSDPVSISEKVIELLKNKELRLFFESNGKDFVLNNFNIQRSAEQLLSFLTLK